MQRDAAHWEAVAGIVATVARTSCRPARMAAALRQYADHARCDDVARMRFRDAADLLDTGDQRPDTRRRVWLVGHIRPASLN